MCPLEEFDKSSDKIIEDYLKALEEEKTRVLEEIKTTFSPPRLKSPPEQLIDNSEPEFELDSDLSDSNDGGGKPQAKTNQTAQKQPSLGRKFRGGDRVFGVFKVCDDDVDTHKIYAGTIKALCRLSSVRKWRVIFDNDERFDLEEDALIPCGNGMDVTEVYTLDEIELMRGLPEAVVTKSTGSKRLKTSR